MEKINYIYYKREPRRYYHNGSIDDVVGRDLKGLGEAASEDGNRARGIPKKTSPLRYLGKN